MQRTQTHIQSMWHFEPLSELALQRYSIDEQGNFVFNDENSGDDIAFVLDLMELYSGLDAFRSERFERYSIFTILEYLERTHSFYESRLLPKMEQAIHSVKRLFPDHEIANILDAFFSNYRNELLEHIDLEETHLFTYARRLAHGGLIRDYSVAEFQAVHTQEVEDSLDKVINYIESDFPEVARSFAYRSFKTILRQFRLDLEIHHLIEEEVFLEKLLNLENEKNMYPFQ